MNHGIQHFFLMLLLLSFKGPFSQKKLNYLIVVRKWKRITSLNENYHNLHCPTAYVIEEHPHMVLNTALCNVALCPYKKYE